MSRKKGYAYLIIPHTNRHHQDLFSQYIFFALVDVMINFLKRNQ